MTPSLGVELPGLDFYEPAFAREVEWALLERCVSAAIVSTVCRHTSGFRRNPSTRS